MQRTKAIFEAALAMGLCLLLCGCLGLGDSEAPPPIVTESHPAPPCPALRFYTVQEQQTLVKEWNALPADDIQGVIDEDWERMRKSCKPK